MLIFSCLLSRHSSGRPVSVVAGQCAMTSFICLLRWSARDTDLWPPTLFRWTDARTCFVATITSRLISFRFLFSRSPSRAARRTRRLWLCLGIEERPTDGPRSSLQNPRAAEMYEDLISVFDLLSRVLLLLSFSCGQWEHSRLF